VKERIRTFNISLVELAGLDRQENKVTEPFRVELGNGFEGNKF
jgi:hypothetical protein